MEWETRSHAIRCSCDLKVGGIVRADPFLLGLLMGGLLHLLRTAYLSSSSL